MCQWNENMTWDVRFPCGTYMRGDGGVEGRCGGESIKGTGGRRTRERTGWVRLQIQKNWSRNPRALCTLTIIRMAKIALRSSHPNYSQIPNYMESRSATQKYEIMSRFPLSPQKLQISKQHNCFIHPHASGSILGRYHILTILLHRSRIDSV